MQFYVGLHQPSDAQHFDHCFISINRLRDRVSNFRPKGAWILDSGAFTELERYGRYRHSEAAYAALINRWSWCGDLRAAVSQDYMCEPFMVARTGLSIPQHQQLTIQRYDKILPGINRDKDGQPWAYLMPVLQGYEPEEYVDHIRQYGDRLAPGAWVGVGSVCKRNSDPATIRAVLGAIKAERKDLRLHGFGVKITSLAHPDIAAMLHSADSMAWSLDARRAGTGANDYRNAQRYIDKLDSYIQGAS